MSKLNARARKALPASDFAGPNRSYPIPDKNHAKAAESMASRFASPAVKAQVDAKVHAKFPGMGAKRHPGGNCPC